ncbi:potassium transporter TrkA [Candidatus Villigracilis affinis]|jgi:voltage-gated potassium channel Kch|uniref:CASTOR/POLLUX-related putative ion channel n=1 Tax=Candidatus Villigracilis affinis TaxID=3140682 RepID=UPI001E109BDC|nr:NAD-binding protein [Anaerolineales bacterium]
MKAPTFKQKFQYWFDNYMSRGTGALIFALFVLSAIIIFVIAALVKITGSAPNDESLFQLAWMGLLRTLDSGTMGGDTGGFFFLLMMLVVTFGGIFVVSALIGIINNGLEDKLDELRKGRSAVLENDHTLILGWSTQVFTVISELVLANESRKSGAVIVILADQDKVEMEDEIADRIPDTKNTRVICRSGNPIDLTDLEIASPHTARSIIILAEGADPDTHIIKSVLAITNNPNRREEPYHIVTQIRDPKNMDVVKMLGVKDTVQPILTNDLIARVVAQTSRQSGLSIVYTELMNFGGDEIYFKQEPELSGKTYGEALEAYETSTLMGIRKADGSVAMNPGMDTRIQSGDHIFVIAEDDDKIKLTGIGRKQFDERLIQVSGAASRSKPERTLILGWNGSGATIIRELDNYVAKGSQVTIVSDIFELDKQIKLESGVLKNQKITVKEGDIRDREMLESLEATEYDHVIVLAYNHLEQQEADAITLITLLHLRDIAERDETPFSIISEMLDLRNRELAEAAKVDDFIVSEHLISLMMTQLSENAELLGVFNDMFDPEGAEIYLKPISDYVVTGEPVNFYTVTEAARRRGETAIGYRVMRESHDAEKAYGVHTNPKKSERVSYSPDDKVIVIADE